MAKGTPSEFIGSVDGSVGVHTRPDAKNSAGQVSFLQSGNGIVLRSRTPRKKSASEAQGLQRAKYSECDCLWKFRDPQQVVQWSSFSGATSAGGSAIRDSYRLFMSCCLNFNLAVYLMEYLFAVWRLDRVTETLNGHRIEIHMGSQTDEFPPEPWWEPESLLNRLP